MIFRTVDAYRSRAAQLGVPLLEPDRRPIPQKAFTVYGHSVFDTRTRLCSHRAGKLLSWLGEFEDCELWVAEFGIWPSHEDLNLVERLRSAFGEMRPFYEAPGHLFEKHKTSDLATFLGITIQFGWGGYVIPRPCHTYHFVSHDGWVQVASKHSMARIEADLDHLEFTAERV